MLHWLPPCVAHHERVYSLAYDCSRRKTSKRGPHVQQVTWASQAEWSKEYNLGKRSCYTKKQKNKTYIPFLHLTPFLMV